MPRAAQQAPLQLALQPAEERGGDIDYRRIGTIVKKEVVEKIVEKERVVEKIVEKTEHTGVTTFASVFFITCFSCHIL